MVKVEICIGSSCHVRGSRVVIQNMEEQIKRHKLEKEVELCGSFCMGICTKGVSVRIDGEQIYHVKPEDANEFFEEIILGRLTKDEGH